MFVYYFRMPYTQSVILEILRVASPVPMTMRASSGKTELDGYPLQKVKCILYVQKHR